MPCYMFMDGIKQEMDDFFEQMAETLHQSGNIHNPPTPTTSTRWKPDGTYDKKLLDPEYFFKILPEKISTPFTCPDCGRIITSKSNLSKHRQTKSVWIANAIDEPLNSNLNPRNSNSRPKSKNYLKKCCLIYKVGKWQRVKCWKKYLKSVC